MPVTPDQLAELYDYADGQAEAIERECCRAGHMGLSGTTHRHEAVNALVEAFDAEVAEFGQIGSAGIALCQDDVRIRARNDCRRRRKDGTYGFIETLLIMIALNLIAKVVVAKLLQWWENRKAHEKN